MTSAFFSDLPLPCAIVGMGVTGTAVKKLLEAAGVSNKSILTFDHNSVEAQFHSSAELLTQGQPKSLIVSPGVPLQSSWIMEAKKTGIFITSELSLASRLLTTESLIAITGSVGKSTTTCLLNAVLEQFCSSFFVGGNLGTPLAIYAMEVLQKKRPRAERVVLELSSYQLENFPELNADHSILTYLTANHLERYNSKHDYFETKWVIEKQTQKSLILNSNGGELQSWLQKREPRLPWIWTNRQDPLMAQHSLTQCELLGSHNLDNIAMAAQLIDQAGWPEAAFEGLKKFPGLPHRVENLGVHGGVRYINDSKATTMESVKIAVQSVLESLNHHQKTLHLLLGGRDKNLPWEELSTMRMNPYIQTYFFGECREKAKYLSQLGGSMSVTMLEALKLAQKKAQWGDAILLSPGGTSLDEFKNFEHRGEIFRSFALNQ